MATTTMRAERDLLGLAAQRRRTGIWLLALTAGLILTGVVAVGSGAIGIPRPPSPGSSGTTSSAFPAR